MRRACFALALAALTSSGCDSGFGVDIDVQPGCAADLVSLSVTAVMHPSETERTAGVESPVFPDGDRHIVVVPPDGTTSITVTVRARGADGTLLSVGAVEVPVDGHQLVTETLVLANCADGSVVHDMAPIVDLQMPDLIPPVKLDHIDVTPTNPSVPLGTKLQLKATGVYSDKSTADLTSQVTWTSADKSVATIDNKGVVSGVKAGASAISAQKGSVVGLDTVTVSAATLKSIQVTPANPTVAAGSTIQFTATGVFSDNSTQDMTSSVTWASTSGAATVDQTGLATGKSAGMASISATFNMVVGASTLTVTAAKLTAVMVTPSNPSLAKGSMVTMAATAVYSDNSTQDVTAQASWATGDMAVATANMNVVSAVGVGMTSVTATYNMVSGSTMVTVTAVTLTSIAIAPAKASMAKGTTQNFTATGTYSDNSTQNLTTTVTWASSDANVAAVSNAQGSQGLVTAVAASAMPVTISATLGNVVGDSTVTVTGATLTSIKVSGPLMTLHSGTSEQLDAVGTYSDNSTQDLTTQATWASSNGNAITVSNVAPQQGVASATQAAAQPGQATITASMGNVVSNGLVLTLSTSPLQSITVTPANAMLQCNTTQQYTATGTYGDGMQVITNDVSWSSGNNAVVTISNSFGSQGLAKAVGAGNTNVTATKGGINGTTNVAVPLTVIGFQCSPQSATMMAPSTLQFHATELFCGGIMTDVTNSATWMSDNKNVVTVGDTQNFNKGLATTGISKGNAHISASYMNSTCSSNVIVQ